MKFRANRANISANIARQHLLPQMLSQFAIATNMLANEKISQYGSSIEKKFQKKSFFLISWQIIDLHNKYYRQILCYNCDQNKLIVNNLIG